MIKKQILIVFIFLDFKLLKIENKVSGMKYDLVKRILIREVEIGKDKLSGFANCELQLPIFHTVLF